MLLVEVFVVLVLYLMLNFTYFSFDALAPANNLRITKIPS